MPTAFQQAVYDLISAVPRGKVTTYKDVAHRLGTGSYRAVGQALRCNPYAPTVPCHRVVAADGSIGGFNGTRAGPDIMRKIALLQQEGVRVEQGRVRDFERCRHGF